MGVVVVGQTRRGAEQPVATRPLSIYAEAAKENR